ncbi:MAG: hypothetical protein AAB915_00400 [Patescibacteria group bacterium]
MKILISTYPVSDPSHPHFFKQAHLAMIRKCAGTDADVIATADTEKAAREAADADVRAWSSVRAGDWLEKTLAELRRPSAPALELERHRRVHDILPIIAKTQNRQAIFKNALRRELV